MGRRPNKTKTIQVPIAASEQIADILEQIAETGLIGQSGNQVALHFVQEGIMKALDNPHFNLTHKKATKRR
jgi:hypothetical protein